MKLNNEQLHKYLEIMAERTEKAMAEDHIIHGYMIYQCNKCGRAYIMNLEKGLEDPTHDTETGGHKPVPFAFSCICCGGDVFHVEWDTTQNTYGKNYRSYKEMISEPNKIIFRNFFWNTSDSDCGVPVIFEPDGFKNYFDQPAKEEKRHIKMVPKNMNTRR